MTLFLIILAIVVLVIVFLNSKTRIGVEDTPENRKKYAGKFVGKLDEPISDNPDLAFEDYGDDGQIKKFIPQPIEDIEEEIPKKELTDEFLGLFEHGELTVQFDYTNAKAEFSKRTVDVKELFVKKLDDEIQNYYLRGFCHTKKAERLFRSDKICNLVNVKTGECFDDIKALADSL